MSEPRYADVTRQLSRAERRLFESQGYVVRVETTNEDDKVARRSPRITLFINDPDCQIIGGESE